MLMMLFVSVILFLIDTRKIKLFTPIFLYVFFSLTTEISATIFKYLFHENRIFFNLYGLFEFISLIYYFVKFYTLPRTLAILISAIYLFVFLITFSKTEPMNVSIGLGSFIWIVLCVYFLISSISEVNNKKRKLIHLFTSSILIYNSSSLTLFLVSDKIFHFFGNLWTIHNVIFLISTSIITYSIWKLPSKSDC